MNTLTVIPLGVTYNISYSAYIELKLTHEILKFINLILKFIIKSTVYTKKILTLILLFLFQELIFSYFYTKQFQ